MADHYYTVGQLKRELEHLDDDAPLAWHYFQVEDILLAGRGQTPAMELSDDDAGELLGSVMSKMEDGLTWELVSYWLDELRLKRETNHG